MKKKFKIKVKENLLVPTVGEVTCPKCKSKLDGATSLSGESPEPGSLSVCMYCGSFLKFHDKPPWLRFASDEDINSLDEENRTVLEVIRELVLEKIN